MTKKEKSNECEECNDNNDVENILAKLSATCADSQINTQVYVKPLH